MWQVDTVTVQGFKSFRDPATIALSPITILAGPNSSGKSSFMQPLLLMKQTLEEQANYGPLLISGPQAKFENYSELFWRFGEGPARPTFSIRGGMIRPEKWYEQSYALEGDRKGKDQKVTLSNLSFHDPTDPRFRERPDRRFDVGDKIRLDELPPWAREVLDKQKRTNGPIEKRNITMELMADRGFLLWKDTEGIEPLYFWDPMRPFTYLLRFLIHLPGLRGNPARQYDLGPVGAKEQEGQRSYPGSFLTYVAGLLYEWSASDDEKIVRLNKYLQRLGFTSGVKVDSISNTAAKIQVQRVEGHQESVTDMVSIADVGLGLSQTLPVLVALLAAHKHSLIHIEQPEIHLHPRAQYELAKIVAECVVDPRALGAHVVVETHSPLFISGFQTLVAQGKFPASGVSLNWFSRDRDVGNTTVIATKLDDGGHFGDWPEDFDEVSLLADTEYFTAQMEHRRGHKP